MLSFVIPAHNEEQHLGRTIAAIAAIGETCGESFEIIVVDDASTDQTANIAAAAGVILVQVQFRQIAATRNAGARRASGDILFFVDADTLATRDAVRAAVSEIRKGSVGGGCVFRFDGTLPIWARVMYPLAVFLARRLTLVGGCFLFCSRDAFDAVGGFCERYYAAEEAAFIRALKRRGRFVVPKPVVVTSGRKLRANSCWRILREAWQWMVAGPESYRDRTGLELWYGERQPDPQIPAEQAASAAQRLGGD